MPFDHSHEDGSGDDGRHDPEKQLLLAAAIIDAIHRELTAQDMCASCFITNLCINLMSDLAVEKSLDDEKLFEILVREIRKATEIKRRMLNASN